MNKDSKIYIAGHGGLVGSAIWKNLQSKGYTHLTGRRHSELDLMDGVAVKDAGALIGQQITWAPSGGVCEGNNLFAAGLPNVDTLGVRGGDIHSLDEYAWPESFVERAQLSALILAKLATGEIPAAQIKAAMAAG